MASNTVPRWASTWRGSLKAAPSSRASLSAPRRNSSTARCTEFGSDSSWLATVHLSFNYSRAFHGQESTVGKALRGYQPWEMWLDSADDSIARELGQKTDRQPDDGLAAKAGADGRNRHRDRGRRGHRHFSRSELRRPELAFGGPDPDGLDRDRRAFFLWRAGLRGAGRDNPFDGRPVCIPARVLRAAVGIPVRVVVHSRHLFRRRCHAGGGLRYLPLVFRASDAAAFQIDCRHADCRSDLD